MFLDALSVIWVRVESALLIIPPGYIYMSVWINYFLQVPDHMVLFGHAILQAVALDDSDVTVWYHLGVVAMKTFDLCLARHSFEEVWQNM